MRYREDVLVLDNHRNNENFCHAAYRNYVLWQHRREEETEGLFLAVVFLQFVYVTPQVMVYTQVICLLECK